MNHQSFETWLFSEEPLSPEQTEALLAHLKTCKSCHHLSIAWNEVEHLFQRVVWVQPAAGFTGRWHTRLFVERLGMQRQKQRRQSWTVLSVNIFGAAIVFYLLANQLLMEFKTPAEVLLYLIERLTRLFTIRNAILEVGMAVFDTIVLAVPLPFWGMSLTILGMLSLVWIYSLRHILVPRRITQ